jgi:hypothetical protein
LSFEHLGHGREPSGGTPNRRRAPDVRGPESKNPSGALLRLGRGESFRFPGGILGGNLLASSRHRAGAIGRDPARKHLDDSGRVHIGWSVAAVSKAALLRRGVFQVNYRSGGLRLFVGPVRRRHTATTGEGRS